MNCGSVIWLTGLPGSGKSTIAYKMESQLKERGLNVEVLDGDVIRRNLSPELGFTKDDRERHNRRVIFLSKLLARNGVVVIVPLISPYRAVRDQARQEVDHFIEVWVRCPLQECIRRDPKGLYAKALKGEIKDMTGLQDTYEEPIKPDLIVDTDKETEEESVRKIVVKAEKLGCL